MKEFIKWYANIEKEYPLYQDKDGYSIGNYRALQAGWKAALEWVKSRSQVGKSLYMINVSDIDEELEELKEE